MTNNDFQLVSNLVYIVYLLGSKITFELIAVNDCILQSGASQPVNEVYAKTEKGWEWGGWGG